jgi:phospho-N-acetylmuramoyl-pentapeptide-transferase
MLYYLSLLEGMYSPLRVFQYITVRTVGAAGTAFLLCVLCGPWMIRHLRAFRIGQQVRTGNAPAHQHKQDTPTMGGLLIIAAMLLACLFWARPSNLFVQLSLGTLCYMGAIGFWDDYTKLRRRHAGGLSARAKMGLQILWAIAVALALQSDPDTATRFRELIVPFHKAPVISDMGMLLAFLLLFVVLVGATNAVNLTDGLDGLAIGCTSSVSLSYLVLSYLTGHLVFADYLYSP